MEIATYFSCPRGPATLYRPCTLIAARLNDVEGKPSFDHLSDWSDLRAMLRKALALEWRPKWVHKLLIAICTVENTISWFAHSEDSSAGQMSPRYTSYQADRVSETPRLKVWLPPVELHCRTNL